MRHIIATAMVVALTASEPTPHDPTEPLDGPPSPNLATTAPGSSPRGRLFATSQGTDVMVFGVNDVDDATVEQVFDYLANHGRYIGGITTDGAGWLFVSTFAPAGMDIVDGELNLVGRVDLPSVGILRNGAYRAEPPQVLLCRAAAVSEMYVFDVADPSAFSLVNVVEIPFTENGGECRDLTFDDAGNLWVGASGILVGLTIDESGNVVTSEKSAPDGNPIGLAFDPPRDRLFFRAINDNFVGVVEPGEPSVLSAKIEAVCDHANNSPLPLTFSPEGDLYVGCGGADGAATDIVAVPALELAGVSGTVAASALDARLIEGAGIAGANHLTYVRSNESPIAVPGSTQTAIQRSSVTLDGTASSDRDGSIVAYAWAFGDGSEASGSVVTHVYLDPGAYTVTLTVTDDGGLQGTGTTTVTVVSASEAVADAITLVTAFEFPKGIDNALSATLLAAQDSLDTDRPAAINQLEAFINQVEALRGVQATGAEADELIAAAREIIAVLEASGRSPGRRNRLLRNTWRVTTAGRRGPPRC